MAGVGTGTVEGRSWRAGHEWVTSGKEISHEKAVRRASTSSK
jgi:hypothetical protein